MDIRDWWHRKGPMRPNRRPWTQVLREAPGDWFWARSAAPGDVLGLLVMGAVLVLGLGVGNAIAINWCVSKIPTALSGGRALRHREFMMWNRTQLYQRPGYMSGPPRPMEVDPNAAGVPPLVARIIRSAEGGNRFARQLDDWLNSRARFPGLAIELSLILFGTLIMPLPRIVLFPLNFIFQQVPTALSIWLSGANRDISRFWRSGARQRSDTLEKYYKRHPEMLPSVETKGVAAPVITADGFQPREGAATAPEPVEPPAPVLTRRAAAPRATPVRTSPVASRRAPEAFGGLG